jgi:ABC-type glycerol-3-phosphate transport system substrate-binding protein
MKRRAAEEEDMPIKRGLSRRQLLISAGGAAGAAALPRFAIGKEQKPLVFWIMDEPNKAPVGSLIEKFTAESGVKVDLQIVPWSDVFTKWTTGFEAGTGADISQCGGMGLFPAIYYDQGRLLDLSDLLAEMGPENSFSSEWGRYKGAVTSVPWFLETRVLWYRKDWLKDAGLEAPRTWAEFDAAAKALTKNGRFGAAFPYTKDFLTGQNNFIFYVNSDEASGLTLAERDASGGLKVTLNRDRFIEATTEHTNFYKNGLVPPSVTSGDMTSLNRLFSLGVAGMVIMNGSFLNQLQQEAPQLLAEDRVGAVHVPGKQGPGFSFLGGSGLWVNKKTEQPDAAKALLKFLNKPESQVGLAKANILNQPSNKKAQTDPELIKNPFFVVLSSQLEKSRAYLWKAGPEPRLASFYGNNIMEQPVLDIVVNNATPAAATDMMQALLQKYLVS